MKTLNFKVTLLSDVIINQRAATEGNQKTLDFIPGNAFLGVAAAIYQQLSADESFTLFHSGKVRFGDAHPLVNGKRAVKVPASWYKRKDDNADAGFFVHHGMPKDGVKEGNNPVQVKQYREDFIVNAGENKVSKVEINKYFAIKSAYDSEKRRSEDAKMYGYESLQSGSEWCFTVEINDNIEDKLIDKLEESLEGNKRIGRSSTAQYGLVKIKKEENGRGNGFAKWSQPKTRDVNENVVFVYAESRLIFIDQYGQPTFTPTAEQLGFQDGQICWEMSQIRTFQYAPYNGKRQTRDADRMGIEKGSVFCVTGATCSETEKWVGSYQNEGFGKVLINPDFLEYTGKNGEAKFSIEPKPNKNETKPKKSNPDLIFESKADGNVWKYLIQQSNDTESKTNIYAAVNEYVNSSGKSFEGKDKFASQWGSIRAIATQIQTKNFQLKPAEKKELLIKQLFEEKEDPVTHKKVGIGYLKHGVALEKWEHKSEQFEKYIKKLKPEIAIETVINLAAEMAKKCRRD